MSIGKKKNFFIFPNVTVSEAQARGLMKLEGSIFLCLPWFFEPPAFLEGMPIKILRPDSASMPSEEFPKVLERYLRWMEENEGVEYASFMTPRYHPEEDFSLEDLKAMIRHGGAGRLPKESDRSFYRHLILHLYGRSEAVTQEAGRLLAQIDKMPSPVAVLLEKPAEAASAFTGHDSPVSDAYPVGTRALEILESWIALFSEFIEPGTDLVALDEWVAEALLSLCGCDPETETSSDGSLSYLHFPEKQPGPYTAKGRLADWISGKHLALFYNRNSPHE